MAQSIILDMLHEDYVCHLKKKNFENEIKGERKAKNAKE